MKREEFKRFFKTESKCRIDLIPWEYTNKTNLTDDDIRNELDNERLYTAYLDYDLSYIGENNPSLAEFMKDENKSIK